MLIQQYRKRSQTINSLRPLIFFIIFRIINSRIRKYNSRILDLLDNHEILFEYSLTRLYADSCNLAVLLSLDVVLHLHSLENDDCIASLYFLTNSHLDAGDSTRERSLYSVGCIYVGSWSSLSIIRCSRLTEHYLLLLWFSFLFHLNLVSFAIYVHACDVTLNSVNLNLVFFSVNCIFKLKNLAFHIV